MGDASVVFDDQTLRRLMEDTDSRSFVLDLARTYLQLLRPRVQRIAVTIAAADLEAALDAARSLKGSSRMTGAVELAELATRIQQELEKGDLKASLEHVALLPDAAARADKEISAFVTVTAATEETTATDETEETPQASSDSIR